MTQTETINPATLPKPTYPPTEGLAKIAGKPITITGFTHTRGRPNKDTDVKRIAADGLVDYYSIQTEEVFTLEHTDKEGNTKPTPINHFYSTPYIHGQLTKWVGSEDLAGRRVGPVKALKLPKKDKPKETFWGLYSEADPEYNQ